ncbi:glycosyltransferase [Vibrio splendidus]
MNRLAVIMSVYRSDKLDYLEEAFSSLLAQDFVDFDIYINIDGDISSDLNEYLSQQLDINTNLLIYRTEVNQGLAHSLNRLIEAVLDKDQYYYIARMDSDDICDSSRFRKQIEFMDNDKSVDVSGSYCREFGASYALDLKTVPLTHEELVNFSLLRCPFIHPTVIFRSGLLKDGNRYPTDTHLTEDMAFWFQLLDRGYRFANLDLPLLKYRLNEDTVNRRQGFKKGFHETTLRLGYMFKWRKVTLKNISLILARLFFHMLPVHVIKYLYKNKR